MNEENDPNKWYSGDWTKEPNKTEPYNGVEITSEPTYDDKGLLTAVSLKINDFTKSETGAEEPVVFPTLLPENPVEFEPKGDFTCEGSVELRKVTALPESLLIYSQGFSYGLTERRHHVEGGLLGVPLVKTPVDSCATKKPEAAQAKPETSEETEGA